MSIKGYDTLVFFDTETTGFDAEKNHIIELAAIRVKFAEACTYKHEMDDFIKLPDGMFIPDEITELTGISDSMLEAEGVFEEKSS